MSKLKALFGLTMMVSLLAISAAPAFAEFESKTAEGKGKAGATTFTDEGATVTCESAVGTWSIRKQDKLQGKVTKGGHLNIHVNASTAKPAGWENCKTSIGSTAEVSDCEFQAEQKAGEFTVNGTIIKGCVVTSPGNCRIKVPATSEKLGKTTLTNVGTNLEAKLEVEGIPSEAESLGGFGCLGIKNLKNKVGKEKGVLTAEGLKAV